MKHSKLAWDLITQNLGNYSGRGVNHEKQNYSSHLLMKVAIDNKMIQLVASAAGNFGEVYHNEVSFLGFDIAGVLTLYVSSNNHPGITAHTFHRIEEGLEGQKSVFFRLGNPADFNSFREEVEFSFLKDGSFKHQYYWGLPGGEFEARSGATMKRV